MLNSDALLGTEKRRKVQINKAFLNATMHRAVLIFKTSDKASHELLRNGFSHKNRSQNVSNPSPQQLVQIHVIHRNLYRDVKTL